jgi:hypothetical protein
MVARLAEELVPLLHIAFMLVWGEVQRVEMISILG